MTTLTLDAAERAARAAAAFGGAHGLNPLSVAVIDISGNLKFALRQDGAGLAGVDIALGKARAALTFGCTSKQIADALSGNALAGPSVLGVLQGRVVLLAGGAPIRDASDAVIGAIAAAGDAPDNDEKAALAGVAAA